MLIFLIKCTHAKIVVGTGEYGKIYHTHNDVLYLLVLRCISKIGDR